MLRISCWPLKNVFRVNVTALWAWYSQAGIKSLSVLKPGILIYLFRKTKYYYLFKELDFRRSRLVSEGSHEQPICEFHKAGNCRGQLPGSIPTLSQIFSSLGWLGKNWEHVNLIGSLSVNWGRINSNWMFRISCLNSLRQKIRNLVKVGQGFRSKSRKHSLENIDQFNKPKS